MPFGQPSTVPGAPLPTGPASGPGPAQSPSPIPTQDVPVPQTEAEIEALTQHNMSILEDPRAKAALLQAGISLLSGRGFGRALGDAGGAIQRYQTRQDEKAARELERRKVEADIRLSDATGDFRRSQAQETGGRVGLGFAELAETRRSSQADEVLEYSRLSQQEEQFLLNLEQENAQFGASLIQQDRHFAADQAGQDRRQAAELDLRRDLDASTTTRFEQELGQQNRQFYSRLGLDRRVQGEIERFNRAQLLENVRQFDATNQRELLALEQQNKQYYSRLGLDQQQVNQAWLRFVRELEFRQTELESLDAERQRQAAGQAYEADVAGRAHVQAAEVKAQQLMTDFQQQVFLELLKNHDSLEGPAPVARFRAIAEAASQPGIYRQPQPLTSELQQTLIERGWTPERIQNGLNNGRFYYPKANPGAARPGQTPAVLDAPQSPVGTPLPPPPKLTNPEDQISALMQVQQVAGDGKLPALMNVVQRLPDTPYELDRRFWFFIFGERQKDLLPAVQLKYGADLVAQIRRTL